MDTREWIAILKRPYKEGDWFTVPIESGYVLGRIARPKRRGNILLGYLFGPVLKSVPTLTDTAQLMAQDAINIVMFGDLGLIEEGWPIIHNTDTWNRNDWPLPLFGRLFDFDLRVGYCTRYDEDDLSNSIQEIRVPAEIALQFPQDRLSGHIALQGKLELYFTEGPKPFDPSERQRSHWWFHGLPTVTVSQVHAAELPLNKRT